MPKVESPSDRFRVDVQELRKAAETPGRNIVRSLWVLGFLFVLSLGLASFWMDAMARREIESVELVRTRSRARVLASLVERDFDRARTVLASIEDRQLFRHGWQQQDPESLRRHLRDALVLEPVFLFASVYTPDGTLIAIEPPDPIVGRNYAHRDWYRGATARRGAYVSEVYRTDAAPNPLVVAVAIPVHDESGQPTGILMAPYTLEALNAKLRTLESDTSGTVYVIDQNGVLIASTNSKGGGERLPQQSAVTKALAGEEGAARTTWNGPEVFAGYAPIPGHQWAVVYTRPVTHAMELALTLRGWGVFVGTFLSVIYLITTGLALKLVHDQTALLAANQTLNKSLEKARAGLEEKVRERTEALRESERQYRLLFESNPHPMWVFEPGTFAFLAVNDAAVHHYGYSRDEFLALTIKDIQPPEAVLTLPAGSGAQQTAHHGAGIWKHKRKDGGIIEVEISSHEIPWLGRPAKLVLAIDVTERRQLEKQYRQSQKMEAVGHLAGGIAHDFNNLLGVILGYCELLAMSPALQEPAKVKIGEIKKAGERAATLTRQLLAFSRKQIVEPVVLDLNTVVLEMSKLLHRLIGEDIELVSVLAPNLGRVKADPGQVEQVLMNLAVNARDAMPRGGKLTIETADVELDEEYARKHVAVEPGRYILLAVSDTGVGMDEQTLARIFEPFFTTKPAGKGTGLGLATVYGIVKQGGGNIWVYSEPGKGTSFKIYFPRVTTPVATARLREAGAAPGGTETLLVVEDAEAMRKMACEFLAARGYTVLQAGDGPEALEMGQKGATEIHLLLTDVVMPGMSGRELAERMTARYPGLKVLFMSGYTGDAVVRHGILEGESAFIQKPFTLHGLAAKVRETLDSAASPPAGQQT